jgi:hypothetical protein
MQQWLSRRYDLLMREYNQTLREIDPCNHDDDKSYISSSVHYIMDGFHPQYYLIDNFDYDLLFNIIINMFYDDLTDRYQDKKERC